MSAKVFEEFLADFSDEAHLYKVGTSAKRKTTFAETDAIGLKAHHGQGQLRFRLLLSVKISLFTMKMENVCRAKQFTRKCDELESIRADRPLSIGRPPSGPLIAPCPSKGEGKQIASIDPKKIEPPTPMICE